ncbi:MAG: hypothetical protein JOZ47_18050 [Kutzneria sp.]|nr:hypothetical protein [Kutzneria sp.]
MIVRFAVASYVSMRARRAQAGPVAETVQEIIEDLRTMCRHLTSATCSWSALVTTSPS